MGLAGMRVLVTRPAARAKDLLAALHEQGAATLHIPMLVINELDAQRDAASIQRNRDRILDLDRYHKLIFISANAVHYGVNLVEQFWPQWPAQQPLLAIGKATATALADRGLNAIGGDGSMNSESLLATDELISVSGERIAIFRGMGGRETLADVIRERGASVDYIECYRRCASLLDRAETLAQLSGFAPTAAIVNSGETLENLTALLPPDSALFDCPLIVPGDRVAALAGNLGYARAIPAANAGTAATLEALHTLPCV